MDNIQSDFAELGEHVGWHPCTPIFMLWTYLDDSGIHNEDGSLARFALGGGIATSETWRKFGSLWSARVSDPSNPTPITRFHYTEWKRAYYGYAKPQHQFHGWTKPQLEAILFDLTRIISKNKIDYLCGSVQAVKGKRELRDSYIKVTQYLIHNSRQIVNRIDPQEKISAVFSLQAELGGIRIQKYWERLSNVLPLGYCVISSPESEPGLQAADLIVNEMAESRRMRLSWGPKFRMPKLKRVMEQLVREPPYHHMIEYHQDDHLAP